MTIFIYDISCYFSSFISYFVLILFCGQLSSFFLMMTLAKGFSILIIFSKCQLLPSLIFFSILFIFSLIFIISFNLYCCCCFNRMSCRYVTKSSWSNVSFNTIVSILTFFRDDLSIFVSRVLKSYYLYCVIVSFSLLCINISVQFSSVQSLSCVQLFATP